MNPILKRTLVALLSATVVAVSILFVPFSVILPVMIALVALTHLEFSLMVARKHEIFVWPGVIAGLAWLVGAFYARWALTPATCVGLAVFAALWVMALFGRSRQPLVALGTTILGFVYIPVMLTFLIRIPQAFGMMALLYIVAIVKVSDMGGFAFGMAFGKHKMCPSISPKKSWEGLAGSVFASVLISCLFMPVTHFVWYKAAVFGIVAALVGTFGDLVESRFKRECEVKDSSAFMPAGMGGLLDMFDSLVFVPSVLLAGMV